MIEMRVHVAILLGLADIAIFGFTIGSNNSVTTWIAAAKYNADGTQVLLAESAEEFVGAIKRIWTKEGLVEHLATNGLELVTHAYSWEASSRRIMQAVAALELGE